MILMTLMIFFFLGRTIDIATMDEPSTIYDKYLDSKLA